MTISEDVILSLSGKKRAEEPIGKQKLMQYNTAFSRLLSLILKMSEKEQLLLLQYAKTIFDERTLPRNACMIPVKYTLEERTYDGLILDINSLGAYIYTEEPFPISKEIHLSFYNPLSHNNMELDGKIIWSSTRGFGVKFNDWSRSQVRW